jgi:hypothetical protein
VDNLRLWMNLWIFWGNLKRACFAKEGDHTIAGGRVGPVNRATLPGEGIPINTYIKIG